MNVSDAHSETRCKSRVMDVTSGRIWHHVRTAAFCLGAWSGSHRALVRWELAGWVDMHCAQLVQRGRCTSLGCRGSLQMSADRSHS